VVGGGARGRLPPLRRAPRRHAAPSSGTRPTGRRGRLSVPTPDACGSAALSATSRDALLHAVARGGRSAAAQRAARSRARRVGSGRRARAEAPPRQGGRPPRRRRSNAPAAAAAPAPGAPPAPDAAPAAADAPAAAAEPVVGAGAAAPAAPTAARGAPTGGARAGGQCGCSAGVGGAAGRWRRPPARARGGWPHEGSVVGRLGVHLGGGRAGACIPARSAPGGRRRDMAICSSDECPRLDSLLIGAALHDRGRAAPPLLSTSTLPCLLPHLHSTLTSTLPAIKLTLLPRH